MQTPKKEQLQRSFYKDQLPKEHVFKSYFPKK